MTHATRIIIVAALTLLTVLSASCRRDPYRVNVSGVDLDFRIRDLGSEIFGTPPNEMAAKADSLKLEYGKVLDTYSTVIGLGDPSDEKWKSAFVQFATDMRNLDLWDTVKKVWPDTERLEKDLESAFRHYRYYFPDRIIPEAVTCISVFNNSIIVDDSLLMVSLDRYLGSDCAYYPSIGIYNYQARKMTPDYTATDCIYAWAATEWDYNNAGYGPKTLLNAMLHEAKLVYFTRRMIPSAADTVLFGFTGKQMEFCETSEGMIWEYLVSKDLLFSTDLFLIRKFTGEAPFTSYFTEESPGRAVVWTGFRIIERYMNNNPDVTMEELMAMTDCQTILAGSKYNPK